MTLERYEPDRIDALALRLLDLACDLRNIAEMAREADLTSLQLHDKKPIEYLTKLEEWAGEALVRCQTGALRHRAQRRATGGPEPRDLSGSLTRRRRAAASGGK